MNTTELKNRGIYGLIFMLILWFGTSYSSLSCSILFAFLGLLCLYEMWNLRKGKSKILALSYVLIPFLLIQDLIWNYLTINVSFENTGMTVWAKEVILGLFVLTWTFDTFALLIGVKYGKHKIIPSISPKKSWEGFIGGLIFTFIASSIYFKYFLEESIEQALILALIIPFTASLGDFIESAYKRQAGVKDSGNLIPGHGGILDRIDSLIVSIFLLSILFRLLS